MAVGFTALANTLLLATLVYREWMSAEVLQAGYVALVLVWSLAWWESRSLRHMPKADSPGDDVSGGQGAPRKREVRDQKFRQAQQSYLAGDWVATEQSLLKLLKQDARDVESRLMLATLWRHQGRGEEALRQLDRLERLENASKWQFEIDKEREAIAQVAPDDLNQPDNSEKPPGRLAA